MIVARMGAVTEKGAHVEIVWATERPGEEPQAFEVRGGRLIPIELGPFSMWWELAEKVAPASAAGDGRCN